MNGEKITIEIEKVCPMCSEKCRFIELEAVEEFIDYGIFKRNYICSNRGKCNDLYIALKKEIIKKGENE